MVPKCKRLFHRDNSIANLVKASYMPLNVGLQLHACIKQTFVSFLQLMFLWPSSAPGTCTWCWGRPAGGDLSLCTLCPPCAGTHWWCPDETSHQLQQTVSTFNNSVRNFETFTTKKRYWSCWSLNLLYQIFCSVTFFSSLKLKSQSCHLNHRA